MATCYEVLANTAKEMEAAIEKAGIGKKTQAIDVEATISKDGTQFVSRDGSSGIAIRILMVPCVKSVSFVPRNEDNCSNA